MFFLSVLFLLETSIFLFFFKLLFIINKKKRNYQPVDLDVLADRVVKFKENE